MPILVFHSPLPIERPLTSGSSVRPKRMLESFRAIGQDVLVVDGDSRTRRRLWKQALAVKSNDLIGVYSELSTSPIALTDPDHLPRAPLMDARALGSLRRRGIPIAAFYRDVHWLFPQYGVALPAWKRIVGRIFHRVELRQLVATADLVYLPAIAMATHVPFPRTPRRVAALPPGCVLQSRPRRAVSLPLRLLYVGGVQPPNYDLSVMLDAIRSLERCELCICCRQTEWSTMKGRYRLPENVRVEHASGDELEGLFLWADAMIFWSPTNAYLGFSMPIKVFESLGWGLPMIVHGETEFGRFVQGSGVGFAPRFAEQLRPLIERLRDDPSLLAAAADQAIEVRKAHTWEARARTVINALRDIRERRA